MLLRHVYLYLNLDEYPPSLATPFGFQTRYVCNFLERRLRAQKFQSTGFSKICVQGTGAPVDSCPILPEHAVVPKVAFDAGRYQSLGPGERHEFFIGMLVEGLEKCARHHRIPLKEFLASIDEFRHEGYENEWVDQSKVLRPAGLRASLLCSLDADRFVLTLQLERTGTIVFSEPILETKPDELIFAYRFKTLVFDGESVVVNNKFDKPLFTVDVTTFRGEFGGG